VEIAHLLELLNHPLARCISGLARAGDLAGVPKTAAAGIQFVFADLYQAADDFEHGISLPRQVAACFRQGRQAPDRLFYRLGGPFLFRPEIFCTFACRLEGADALMERDQVLDKLVPGFGMRCVIVERIDE